MPSRLVILSGPRGAGKGTLVGSIQREFDMYRMTSCTTRAPRVGEIDGQHYHFVTDSDLDRMHARGELFWRVPIGPNQRSGLEIAEVDHTNCGVIDVYPEGARIVRDYVRSRGGDALLLAVFAPAQERMRRIASRPGTTIEEACRLFFEDPVSDWRPGYLDFNYWIDNSNVGDPGPACETAIRAVREFLNGSTV
jgi:guanylate kinase